MRRKRKITHSDSNRTPFGVSIDEFIERLGLDFPDNCDLTWEALWSISRVFQALLLLGNMDKRIYDQLRYLWQYVLRLRARQPEDKLDLSVLNRYGEFCGSTRKVLLTDRERDVLILVGLGYSNQAIAQKLTISINTVKAHLRSVFQKLGVSNRTAAAALAYRCQLLGDEDQDEERNWRTIKRTRRTTYA